MQTIDKKTILFIGAIGVQLLALLVLGLAYGSIAAKGTDVLLKIAPVDPRDPLRGDYVTFRYDISSLSQYLLYGGQVAEGDTVYVALRSGYPYWQASGVYTALDAAQRSIGSRKGAVIKGTVASGGGFSQAGTNPGGTISVRYDIEQFFIPEGAGRGVSFWNKEAYALVKVDNNGNALIQRLYVDGQPWP